MEASATTELGDAAPSAAAWPPVASTRRATEHRSQPNAVAFDPGLRANREATNAVADTSSPKAGGGTRPHQIHQKPPDMRTARLARQPPREPPAALRWKPRGASASRADFQERRVRAAEPDRAAPDEAFPLKRNCRCACSTGWAVSQDSAAATSSGSRSPSRTRAVASRRGAN